jgi:uncharacterized protein YndB with AHSA1/START domain
MPNIVHRIGTSHASPQEVYQSLATREGLARWWTTKVTGECNVGRVLKFRFDGGGPDFEFAAAFGMQ